MVTFSYYSFEDRVLSLGKGIFGWAVLARRKYEVSAGGWDIDVIADIESATYFLVEILYDFFVVVEKTVLLNSRHLFLESIDLGF
jgi:hypothetical protein